MDVQPAQDKLAVTIRDNGRGMTAEEAAHAEDPFFTTRTTRKVGLGIPFFRQAAVEYGGSFQIDSEKGKGTTVKAVFGLSHIDRMPLGDISSVIHTLIVFNGAYPFPVYIQIWRKVFCPGYPEIREILGEGISLREPEVSAFIKEYLESGKTDTDEGADI